MGWVGFYEEKMSLYTFLGDHSYSLSFAGSRGDFLDFVRRTGLSDFKISDNEYSEKGKNGQWKRGASFHENDALRTIQYYSIEN